MKLVLTSVLLSCVLFLSAQSNASKFQIIAKFESDPCPNSGSGIISGTGNLEFDAVTLAYQGFDISKHREGKKSDEYFFVIRFANENHCANALLDYRKINDLLYVERDGNGSSGGMQLTVPNDQYYSNQWGLRNDGSFSQSPAVAGADIDMENAWTIEQGDTNIVVGTIDTGLKLDHPEFYGRLWVNYGEISGNFIDDDLNGYVDDVNGWDFANNDNNPTDDHGHGTNVTGIIGATGNNSIGYAGVDWNCKLMTLKGLDASNFGSYSWWADALYYATDNGVNVINMSVGGSSFSTTLQAAINYALNNNVTIVACMMNTDNNTTYYPAGFVGVIAVGSTNANDTRSNPFFWSSSSGSNFGNHISVVAPGNYIYGLSYSSNTNYNSYWGGTSQATPLVAGLAALLIAQNPSLTPAQIKSIIELSAEDQVGLASEDVAGWDQYFGHGRVNAFQALMSTSIQGEGALFQEVVVFPNPSADIIWFTFDDEAIKENSVLTSTIYDLLGKPVQQQINVGPGNHSLDCTLLADGVYFLVLESSEGIRKTSEFVVR